VAGGDLNAARGRELADRETGGRRGGDADIEDGAAHLGEAGDDGVAEHFPRRPAIAREYDRLPRDRGTKRRGKPRCDIGGEAVADQSPYAGDGDK
jgi:hypothetical protein